MVRPVKREPGLGGRTVAAEGAILDGTGAETSRQEALERRALRSRYLAVKNLISDERDDISRSDSQRFKSIISEVEALHRNVKKPREQVADAETLLDIAKTLVSSVRSESTEGVTPSDFVTAILKNFSHVEHREQDDNSQNVVSWEKIGISLSHIFQAVSGCCTMIGPMSNEIRQRKVAVHRKRTRPTDSIHPEEIDCDEQQAKTDTDNNVLTMFDVLKRKRKVRLENLLLNRLSFAQTVENIFALSFLVKDGRAEITVDEKGCHLVSPRNAPAASAVASGEVSYHHFIFRFDFKDWKSMIDIVRPGEELMPLRSSSKESSSQAASSGRHEKEQPTSAQQSAQSTPIRKLTRNRGLVIQEDTIVEDSLEREPPCKKTSPSSRMGKRLF
ncbi:hypothetical protein HPP92_015238 [Vanilla planifolia]|uniref:Non-structural maintenance of chromosomes element 4 n=1 Tax=Vanilla planifolia TaxID=51239 RepID=A0A835UVI4_VANPL|nr:hypothetical protein HPP92_015238 [Vanilla planifolia]